MLNKLNERRYYEWDLHDRCYKNEEGECVIFKMAKRKTKKYDWKKTGVKFLKALAYVVLAGLASVYGNNPAYLALAPLFHALENYLKHK